MMKEILLPYGGKKIRFVIKTNHLIKLLDVRSLPPIVDLDKALNKVLNHPAGTLRFERFFKNGQKVGILVSDITRLPTAKIYLPGILQRLNALGIPDRDISIIFTTGAHRRHTKKEQRFLVGDEIYQRIKVFDHDCHNKPALSLVGRTRYGNKIFINRRVLSVDRLIATGKIDFHYFAGYGGGRKSILPGICGFDTIRYNHQLCLHNKGARAGEYLRNPVNQDMLAAVKFLKPVFMINVVLNQDKKICKFFAGDLIKAHRQGCKFIDKIYRPRANFKADLAIVSAGGRPLDINFVQVHKAIDNAKDVIKKGGVMIVLAECREGFGSRGIEKYFKMYTSENIESALRKRFTIPGHTVYAALVKTKKFRIIFVSKMSRKNTELMSMIYAKNIKQAFALAEKYLPVDFKTYVIPNAAILLPKVVLNRI
ncbi:MAG: nickel-dependent lactate racemase [Candidatus Omnitrophota bacterium]